jgi:uncharacterized SAM-binding protein YcdF (DUF218 family)
MSCDAVIVLANEMDKDGVLNEESSLRANLAAKMAKDYKIPHVITCGWAYRADSDIKIADAFKSYIVKLGVRAEQILTEENSRDTVGDAVFTRLNLVEPLGFRNFFVVTSNYHVARTRKVFNFVYGSNFRLDVIGADVEFDDSFLSKETESEIAFDRTFCDVNVSDMGQIMEALRNNHPFYNGELYSKI